MDDADPRELAGLARAMILPGVPPSVFSPSPGDAGQNAVVPRWALLAVPSPRPSSRLHRGLRRLVSLAAGAAVVLGGSAVASVVTGTVVTGLGALLLGTTASAMLLRGGALRRLAAAREASVRASHATALRERLLARLNPDEREELARLEFRVDQTRLLLEQHDPAGIATRLDPLIHLYVELSIEAHRMERGCEVGASERPSLSRHHAGHRPDELKDWSRRRRIVHLRIRARDRCRRRLAVLEESVASIREMIRLLHEQSLAASACDDLGRSVAALLDDAERAWRAGEEVEATLEPERWVGTGASSQ